jgi:lipopolysaccharide/colanic/teichoic acid biosynthesis glycosyltransferase
MNANPVTAIMLTRAPQKIEPNPKGFDRTLRLKRIMDYILASICFIGTLPVTAIAVMLVKLSSRGPAIYSQARIGLNGKPFIIYKIRTMRNDCEKNTGPRWSSPRDPRVTRVGKILRKLHIDEFPQFWNVLRGEMSLVGPRPERPEIVAKLRQQILDYDLRSSVLPGVTGYAQIHLPPDTCIESVRMKLEYDRYYIRNLSLKLDLRIFVCTALKMIGLYRLEEVSLPSIKKDEPIDPVPSTHAA